MSRVGEPVGLLTLVQDDLKGGDPDRQQGESDVVDSPARGVSDVRRILDEDVRQQDRQDPDRHVDIEDPPPGVAVGHPSADGRAEDGRDDDPERVHGHRDPPALRRKALEEHRLRDRLKRPAAGALEDAGADQHRKAGRDPAEAGGGGENAAADGGGCAAGAVWASDARAALAEDAGFWVR